MDRHTARRRRAHLRDPDFSSVITFDAAAATGDPPRHLYAFVHSSLVFSDPPSHTRLRRLVSRGFTPAIAGHENVTSLLSNGV
ncbi:hypothetical protein ACFYOA_26195 [Streptomyces iakyrus]|uniref:hypothetical protein n=1 Tax=Streptomyces iakyrus TaxID=68219 RepID=UPI00369DEFD1